MIGETFGNYRIVEMVGEGGMGTVYRATENLVERDVAIKVLRPEFARNPELNERFRTEAKALARLNHPAIATLYSFFQEGNELFMAMEFVPGETLEKRLQRQGAMPWQQAVEVLLWSLDAVRHAHQMGILHRDLKPANIMITPDGRVKVTDFGIARVLNAVKLTREARIVGTVEYLAPERALGKPADARSDLYSLGIVFYEMLTGRVPFQADSDIGLLRAQIEDQPARPKELGVDVPVEVERALMKALAKDPEERFPDAASFASAFREAVRSTGMPLGNRPTRLAEGSTPLARRKQPADSFITSALVKIQDAWDATWHAAVRQLGRQYALATAAAAGTILLLGFALVLVRLVPRSSTPARPAVVEPSTPDPQPAPVADPVIADPIVPAPFELQPIAPPVTLPSNPSPAQASPKSPAPNPAPRPTTTPTPATPNATGAKPDKGPTREAVLAALEERDNANPTSPTHPVHYTGLLKAIRLGAATAAPWITEVVERRGVNFRPTQNQMAELRAAGAPDTLILVVAGSFRAEAVPTPAPPPTPTLAAPAILTETPKKPAPRPTVRRLGDIQRLSVDTAEPELRAFLYQELEEAFKGKLNIVKTPGPADAVLRVKLEEEDGGNKVVGAAGRVFGMKGKVRAVAEVAEMRDGVVLWHSVAGDRSFGGLGNGARRVASRVAKQLKDDWKN